MQHNIWIYLFVMAAVSYGIRVLPLTLLRGQVKSPFLRSFLYYVPYVTLAVMTFPAMLEAAATPAAGFAALAAGLILAWMGAGLFPVAAASCAAAFLAGCLFA